MPKKILLFCKPAPFNWNVVPELPSRLQKMDLVVKTCEVSIRRYPTNLEFDNLEEALIDVRANGQPKGYDLKFEGETRKSFGISRFWNINEEEILRLDLTRFGSIEDARSLADFLGLEVDTISAKENTLEKKCFIAHRFDEAGTELADKLARLLSLLNFEVTTGRAFAPGSISEKVRTRIDSQSLVFAILTSGNDPTWLTQESLLGSLKKPLFLLKDKDYEFKPALLGDHEYITDNNRTHLSSL